MGKEKGGNLNCFANIERGGLSKDKITEDGAFEVADAEVDAGDPPQTRCHVGPHARQRLCY